MHCHRLKRPTMIIFSVTLLYYGVAWTVLNCFHEEKSSYIAAYIEAMGQTSLDHSEPIHAHTDIECLGPKYHTEFMAESSSTSRFHQFTVDTFVGFRVPTAELPSNLLAKAVFERFGSVLSIGPPRYLSLSILRL